MIRAATIDDLPAIERLEHEAFEHGRWSTSSWASEIDGSDRYCIVDDVDGVHAVATFQALGDVVDLHRVIVAAPSRGRGLARELVQAGRTWALEQGADKMMLEVSTSNVPALALYRRCGFVDVARRENYYAPGEAALVMEVSL